MLPIQFSELWRAFWRGEHSLLLIEPDGSLSTKEKTGIGVLPGSFNPLHDGHRKLAKTAAQIVEADVLFELSVTNVDKTEIGENEVLRRIEQFFGYSSIAITRAATFLIKANLFKNSTFIVGYDTAERILSPRYYSDE